MSYSYDYLQAHLADLYHDAEHRRMVNAVRRRPARSRWGSHLKRRRRGALGACGE